MNHQEYEALEDERLPHEARSLYVMCIRRYMDYETGLTGIKRKVSYQMFKERLEVHRPARSPVPSFIPTKKQLRGYIEHLERAGLIEKLPQAQDRDPMIFRCLLARTGSIRLQEEGHKKGTSPGHTDGHGDSGEDGHKEYQEPRGIEPNEGREQAPREGQEEGHSVFSEVGQTSVTSVSTTATTHASPEEGEFPMHMGWKPSSNLGERLKLFGIDLESIPVADRRFIFAEFVNHWLSTPSRRHRQSEWDKKLIDQIARHVRGGSHGKAGNSDRTPGTGRTAGRAEVAAALGDIDHDFLN